MTFRYNAFLSYNRGVDLSLSADLQRALQQFAKPWYALRALRIFRDTTALSANPDLWANVVRGLDSSEFLVLLASPEAAASSWVRPEIQHWLATKPAGTMLIALTGGELVWDPVAGDFDWGRTTALPEEILRGVFRAEPNYVDLRAVKTLAGRRRARVFRDLVADIAATLHRRPKDDLVGDDIRIQRRNRFGVVSGIVALAALTAISVTFGITAGIQQRRADQEAAAAIRQARAATSRHLAGESIGIGTSDTTLARLLAAAALRLDDNLDARRAALAALQSPQRAVITAHPGGIETFAFSADGSLSTAGAEGTVWVWDTTGRAQDVLRNVAGGDTAAITAAAFSPDGTRFAVASGTGPTRLWEVASGDLVAELGSHANPVRTITFSPDGGRLYTASFETTRVWDADTGDPLGALPELMNLIQGFAFSADGGRLATLGPQAIHVWEISTGELLTTIAAGVITVGLAFSPDGETLATAGVIEGRLWDVASGEPIATLPVRISSMVFSPDGTRLATASDLRGEFTAHLWDARTGQPRAELVGHANGETAGFLDAGLVIAFSPDGSKVATGGSDATVRLWDAHTGTPIATLTGHTNPVVEVRFSPDGALLASVTKEGTVRLWDTSAGQPRTLAGHTGRVTAIAYHPDGELLATAGDDGTARLWDGTTGEPVAVLSGHSRPISVIAFSPDGQRLASGSEDMTIRVWDAATGALTATIPVSGLPLKTLEFSPDGSLLAFGGGSNAELWDVETADQVAALFDNWSDGVTFSPDGRQVATVGPRTQLWDVDTHESVAEFGDEANLVAYSPDGTMLATASAFDVALWDVATRGEIATLSGETLEVRALAFSPDGRRLATASGDVARLWDTATGAPVATLAGHGGPVRAVAFSPDGTRLATVGDDRTARLWDVATGGSIGTFAGHSGPVTAVAYHPGGAFLATASDDGAVRLWRLPEPVADLYTALCALAGRAMTPEEWATYAVELVYEPVCGPIS